MRDKDYLIRCIELAKLGGKDVRPNPHVGSIIVYKDRIIGEGYHQFYGGPHAEVNAINNVREDDRQFLTQSTMYVSLEPCCHFGITPPCTNLIIKNKIPRVCISEIDPTQKVNSKGVNHLKQNGIEVDVIPIPNNNVIAEFKVNQLENRPFVQLKFAKSKDNFIGQKDRQVWLSNDTSAILTHKLRSYTDAILVGTNTTVIDNPALTLRNHPGKQPQRIVLDREGRIPTSHQLLSDHLPCIIFTKQIRDNLPKNKHQIIIDFSSEDFINTMLRQLFELEIYHLTVEGGAKLLKSFVSSGFWDEAVIIKTPQELGEGVSAPNLNGKLKRSYQLVEDQAFVLKNV